MDETANEIKRLQGCINDLISVLALPAMWIGQDPEQIVSTLLDVLVGILRLDFAYVRLNQPVGGDLIEVVRHDPLRPLVADSRSVGQTFNDSFGAELRKWPPRQFGQQPGEGTGIGHGDLFRGCSHPPHRRCGYLRYRLLWPS